jgi:hypothetical protein
MMINIVHVGNTEYPAMFALKGKGYKLVARGYGDRPHITATKDGNAFHASNAVSLLGLISMWEERGDNWRAWSAAEKSAYANKEIYEEITE